MKLGLSTPVVSDISELLSTGVESWADVEKAKIDVEKTAVQGKYDTAMIGIQSAADVLKEGLKVWQSYVSLSEAKEKTKQALIKNQTELEKIRADLQKAELHHAQFMEKTVDIRSMINLTEERITPLGKLMDMIVADQNVLLEGGDLFNKAMTVQGEINNLLISLHRFMEKR